MCCKTDAQRVKEYWDKICRGLGSRCALHPERIVRRLRNSRAQVQRLELCSDIPSLVDRLRFDAESAEKNAKFWEGAADAYREEGAMEHIVGHYRRIARRLHDAADAIEREHAAGPWITLDQPFVHLSEARPARQEEEVAH